MANVWWCNQTKCWDDERPANLVCSHVENQDGANKFRRMVAEARAGDITVHYRSGRWMSIVALSRALTDPVEGVVDLREYGVNGTICWEQPGRGWRFEAEYFDLSEPVPKSAMIEALNDMEIEDGPIAPRGQIRQGYFMRFSAEGLRIVRQVSREGWPAWAEDFLASHEGHPEYYFFNTDSISITGPSRFKTLIDGGFAVTSGARRYGEELGRLNRGDTLLMYQNSVGVVAVGAVLDRWDGVSHTNPLYYRAEEDFGGYEYRIGVDWFLNLSSDPITISELLERLGYTPRRTLNRIVEARDEVAAMIAERRGQVGCIAEEILANHGTIAEGARTQIWVNAYERSATARRRCIAKWGYTCQVCGQSLEDIYGVYGADFVHVHHLTPLSQVQAEYEVDPEVDLMPVCPNCHAILHRRNPPYSIEEIRASIQGRLGRTEVSG